MITHVCWLVRSFCDNCCDFSQSISLIFMKLGTVLLLTFERSRSMFKVISFVHDPPSTMMIRRKH